MSDTAERRLVIDVRELRTAHLEAVARIDGLHTGREKPDYWDKVLRRFLEPDSEPGHVGLAAEEHGRLIGYLLGEVRAFEFGSEPCGWVFAVGVDPQHLLHGVASALLGEACRRFREAGVTRVRTMVPRSRVDVLSFFRSNGFVGGSFVQLELDLEAHG